MIVDISPEAMGLAGGALKCCAKLLPQDDLTTRAMLQLQEALCVTLNGPRVPIPRINPPLAVEVARMALNEKGGAS
jgi:hypothetical protein